MTVQTLDVALDAGLKHEGYCILRGILPACEVEAIAADLDPVFEETPFSQGLFYGEGTRRFGGLLSRSKGVAACVQHSDILALVNSVLGPWCEHVSLNLTQAIDIAPGARAQVPHRDQDMWPCSAYFDKGLGVELLVNVMWPLQSFTADNGATRLWPGSHRYRDQLPADLDGGLPAEMEPGDALLFLGSTLHCGGANLTARGRRGMIISYTLGWLKPYELQWLVYPPSIARQFESALSALAGYRIHRPNLGNVEGQCPSRLLEGEGMIRGAVDALRPDQVTVIEDYLRRARTG